MKKQYKLLTIIICLWALSAAACAKQTKEDEIDAKKSEAVAEIETEAETEIAADQTSSSVVLEEDSLMGNWRYLKSGDTKPLVGLSFGDRIDYDKYHKDYSAGNMIGYCFKDGSYENKSFFFHGKGGGFNGLRAISGDFFGIALWEDSLEALTKLLGEADMTEKETNGQNGVWVRWNFEKATLSAKIKDGKICEMTYFANGTAADAEEKAQTDFEADRKTGNQTAKTVYRWAAYEEEADMHTSYTPYDEDYDAAKVDSFLQEYLLSQGFDKAKPEGISYYPNGEVFVEYYNNEARGQYCFILHLWHQYCVDREKNEWAYQEAVYGTTHTLDGDDKSGYMLYEQNTEQNARRERMYDIWGNQMAEVSYEYVPNMPFPLITKEWNFTADFLPAPMLCNQKMWFYKEEAQFDSDGKFLASTVGDSCVHNDTYFPYSCRAVYDKNGRLQTIEEELQTDDADEDYTGWSEKFDYSGQMTFSYNNAGILERADYARSSYTHGTWDSNGEILYDEMGRMIYNSYYVTHGTDAAIYLYDGDSDMPWCVLNWCSHMPGIEAVSLFLPEA